MDFEDIKQLADNLMAIQNALFLTHHSKSYDQNMPNILNSLTAINQIMDEYILGNPQANANKEKLQQIKEILNLGGENESKTI
jgi:hypothetical protein